MDNPTEEKTTINVKGVSVLSWESARKLAAKHGETMGTLLSRAIDQMANTDVLPREIQPDHGANPSGNPGFTGGNLVDLFNATAALAAATGGNIKVVPGLSALLRERVRAERGIGPSLRGKASGKEVNLIGQSVAKPALVRAIESGESAGKEVNPERQSSRETAIFPAALNGAEERISQHG